MIECKSESLLDKVLREMYLEKYSEKALKKSPEEIFSSDSGGTTKLLLSILFKNYNKSVKIFGTSLCNKILMNEECRKRLDMFEYPAQIILTKYPNYIADKIKHDFLNNMNSNAQVKEMGGYAIQNMEKKPETEFLILDDIAYFLELTNSNVARCNFNNPPGVLNLSKTFDEIYNKH